MPLNSLSFKWSPITVESFDVYDMLTAKKSRKKARSIAMDMAMIRDTEEFAPSNNKEFGNLMNTVVKESRPIGIDDRARRIYNQEYRRKLKKEYDKTEDDNYKVDIYPEETPVSPPKVNRPRPVVYTPPKPQLFSGTTPIRTRRHKSKK